MRIDNNTLLLVRGVGFQHPDIIENGQEIAVMSNNRHWGWEYPKGLSKVHHNGDVDVVSDTDTDVLGTFPFHDSNTYEMYHGAEWNRPDKDMFIIGKSYLPTMHLMVVTGAFVKSGRIVDDGITIANVDDNTLNCLKGLDLAYECIGDSVNIKLPNTIKWYFTLCQSKIPQNLKSLASKYLQFLWRPFINEEVHTTRLVGDLTEIVCKTRYTPMWIEDKLFHKDVIKSEVKPSTKDFDGYLYNLDNQNVLLNRNGKVSFI